MRKSRIFLLCLFIPLSFVVFRVMGAGGNHFIVDQSAVVKDTITTAAESAMPSVVLSEGVSPEIVSSGSIGTVEASASSTGVCGGGIGARFGLVRQLNSSTVPFERGAENRWPIASITKLMTAIVASEQGVLAKQITFVDAMTAAEGDAGGFKTGDVMAGADIAKGMLLISSNDAAEALAQSYGRDAFIRAMNDKASELHMLDTTFADPSGLSPRNQSTAVDLYKLMSYLHDAHPELLQITRTRKVTVTELQTKRKRTIANIDAFAGQANFIGGKTGYITEAEGNGNLVTLFTKNDQPFVIVVLGSPDRFGETRTLLKCI